MHIVRAARNTTCSLRQLCVHWKIVVIHLHGHDDLYREMGTNGDVREQTAMAWHQCPLKIHGRSQTKLVCLVQEHLKISSKASYGNGCGVGTMETILSETSSAIADLCELREDA